MNINLNTILAKVLDGAFLGFGVVLAVVVVRALKPGLI